MSALTVSINNQAYVFLCAVIGGMLIAFAYDLIRIKRRTIKTNITLISIEDLIYWIIVAITMFFLVFYSNDGVSRGFIFIGAVLGVIIYIFTLSKFVISASVAFIRIVYRILKFIWNILIYPFAIIFRIIAIPLRLILKLCKKLLGSAKRSGKARVKQVLVWKRLLKNIKKKI